MMQMRYEVRFVGDADLPNEVDYAFVRLGDKTYLFMKRSACNGGRLGQCEGLTRSFNTWQQAQSVELKELAGAL
jgi:hypothetical protein